MKRREWRKRKVANDFARANKLRPAQGYRCVDAITKVCAALGPLNQKQKARALTIVELMLRPL